MHAFAKAVGVASAESSIRSIDSNRGAVSKDVYFQKKIMLAREVNLTRLCLGVTLVAAAMLLWQVGATIVADVARGYWVSLASQILFLAIAFSLIYGNLVYQLTRIGYMRRLQRHSPANADQLGALFDGSRSAPALVVLVPSYKEDTQVVRRTLLSAAMQDYPDKRVVLLIDDPASPGNEKDKLSLAAAQELPIEIQKLLDPPAIELAELRDAFVERQAQGDLSLLSETLALANATEMAAVWFETQARVFAGPTHSDELFVTQTFTEPARELHERVRELRIAAEVGGPYPTPARMLGEYRRLAARFRVRLSSFQRKRYVNLSHESNKAMNLNSYIGLLGGKYVDVSGEAGLMLEAALGRTPTLDIPRADYIVTLDADSIIAPQYALRLIEFAQRPENARVAVVQTPYSAEPNPPGLVERIAGATTDMQYLIHQGFTHYNATFWVGANALLRPAALNDICVIETERGYPIRRFIQDRTVIEDTESSVDLASKGWTLHNYPERLSHSATPADFGSLVIQRRRWANGGLIILPKLLRYMCCVREFFPRARESFFRMHYLVSIALVNLSLPIMLLCPFEDNLRNIWFPLSCLPYFFLYSRDLMQAGYSFLDFFRVYALNLILVPVNLAGVFKSIHQGWTKEKIPFKRTPKVSGRTTAAAGYILTALAMGIYCAIGVVLDTWDHKWLHAIFGGLNGLFVVYALLVFVGIREGWEDVMLEMPTFQKCISAVASFFRGVRDWIASPMPGLSNVKLDE